MNKTIKQIESELGSLKEDVSNAKFELEDYHEGKRKSMIYSLQLREQSFQGYFYLSPNKRLNNSEFGLLSAEQIKFLEIKSDSLRKVHNWIQQQICQLLLLNGQVTFEEDDNLLISTT